MRGRARTWLAAARAHRLEIAGLAGLYLVTALYFAVQAARVKSYSLMVDELLYTKAAQGFSHSLFHSEVYNQPYPVPNGLYSRFLAIPYGLLGSLNAFTAGHILNALLFAGAAIPVYLLARRLGAAPLYSLLGAALAVWVPWAVATTVLMSESAAYPAFAWAMLAAVVAIEDPRPRNDALLLVAAAAMLYSRTQFIVVLPVIGVAFLAHEVAWPETTWRGFWERTRAHWLIAAAVAFVLFVWLVFSPDFLGNYGRTAHVPRFPPGLLDSMADHLTHIVLGAGVLPALLWFAWVVRSRTQPDSRANHVFAYLSGLTALVIIYEAGFFSRQIAGGRLQERYAFYIVALFAAGAAALLSARLRRPPIGSLVAGVAVMTLAAAGAAYPQDTFGVQIILTAASGFTHELADAGDWLRHSWSIAAQMALLIGLVAGIYALAHLAGRWRAQVVAGVAVAALVFCMVETHVIFNRFIPSANATVPDHLGHPPKAWIDGLLYKGDDEAGAVEGYVYGDQQGLWEWLEFWNKRVTRLYQLDSRPPPLSGLPSTPMTLDVATGRLTTAHELPALVVSTGDPALAISGQPIRTIGSGQQLMRPVRPYRAAWVYGNGGPASVVPRPTALTAYPPPGMTTARMSFDIGPTDVPGRLHTAAWRVRSNQDAQSGLIKPAHPVRVTVTAKVEPGSGRAIVLISSPRPAPAKGTSAYLELRNVVVDWS